MARPHQTPYRVVPNVAFGERHTEATVEPGTHPAALALAARLTGWGIRRPASTLGAKNKATGMVEHTATLHPEQLSHLAIFAGQGDALLEDVARRSRGAWHTAGSEILSQHGPGRDAFFIISGRVRVNLLAQTGRLVTYELLPPGEMFGELAALDGLPRSTGIFAEDDCYLGKLSSQDFMALVRAHPDFAVVVMMRLARLARALAAKVFEYHAYNVRGRVYAELLRQHHLGPGAFSVSAKDMASRVGTTRPNVSRIYSDLRRRAIISRAHTRLEVLDPKRLEDLLENCEFG